MKRVKQIQAGLSLLVLVALLGSWSGQIAHLLLVPHHFCFGHDEISHEDVHHDTGTGWLATEVEGDDHCTILATFLRSGAVTPTVSFSEQPMVRTEVVIALTSFPFFTSDLFLLAPKNSPPASA